MEFDMCDICFLSKENNPNAKFYSIGDGVVPKTACEHCVDFAKEIVERCEKQCENPKSDQFKGLDFWWKPKNGESAIDHAEAKKI
jgi:hypothetical protein